MGMKIINISDIEGFRLGNAENKEKGTGCTVIICEEGAVGGVDVRGGGPATRETDLLRSENTVNAVNAVILSGGSAFGLEAASGVMRELSERDIGFDVGVGIKVPIVCGASLFDLAVGDPAAFPDVNMGAVAVRNAYEGLFWHGNHGAGTGATVGKYLGHDRAMKTGLGTFACGDGFVEVGAIAAVNAIGDVYNGAGNIIAGLRSEDGESIYGTIKTLKGMVHENTGLIDDSTSFINRSEIEEALAASGSQEEIPDAAPEAAQPLVEELYSEEPFEVSEDEATAEEISDDPATEVFEASAEEEPAEEVFEVSAEEQPAEEVFEAPSEEEPAETLFEAKEEEMSVVPSTVVPDEPEEIVPEEPAEETPAYEEAKTEVPESDIPVWEDPAYAEPETESFREPETAEPVSDPEPEPEHEAELEQESEPEEEHKELSLEEMGYNIAFNTTIGCLITNAALTKSQANKLASILHDAYARAIKPVHGTLDGDTIFVLTTGKQQVNFDAFAALATDVMQYAVIDGATSATGAYGLPSARDMKKPETE